MSGKKPATKTNAALLQQIAGLLEQQEKADADATTDAALAQAKRDFWIKMRTTLAANESSGGLEILDDVATAILDDAKEPQAALSGPILILPPPSRQREAKGPSDRPEFASNKKRASSDSPTLSRTRSGKKPKTVSPSATETESHLDFKLSDRAPAIVRRDLEELYTRAADQDSLPFQLAYPWEGKRLWYDPEAYPHIHVAHWRWYMSGRPRWWEWGLHAPLTTDSAHVQRRKRKMAAIAERLAFFSLCIETWGWYAFLERLETSGNKNLLWWGGMPGRNSSDAKNYDGPIIRDLGELSQKDKLAYRSKVRDALTPFQLDKGGFESVPSLLELTGALDPSQSKVDRRLSDRALARISLDVTSKKTSRPHWKGDHTKGAWSKLLNDSRIKQLQIQVGRDLLEDKFSAPTVPAYQPKESRKSGYSPFKTADGQYTALPPEASDEEDDDQEAGESNNAEEEEEEAEENQEAADEEDDDDDDERYRDPAAESPRSSDSEMEGLESKAAPSSSKKTTKASTKSAAK